MELKGVMDETVAGSHISWKRRMFGHFCDLHCVLLFTCAQIIYRVATFLSHCITGTDQAQPGLRVVFSEIVFLK